MDSATALHGYMIARQNGLSLHEITVWAFDKMKQAESSHYCCYCRTGFQLEEGIPHSPSIENTPWLKGHDVTHDTGVIPDVEKYSTLKEWIESNKDVSPDFKFLIAYK